jgi:NAD(P)-dependent dehydrogenase (short-subunit alcohol dehydrogenase family)
MRLKEKVAIVTGAASAIFTGGTDDGRQTVVASEPVGRPARPEEIAAAVVWLCVPTPRLS